MRPIQLLRRLIFAAATVITSSLAPAQQLPGAGAFAPADTPEGHGWLLIGQKDSPVLVHIPPRGSIDVGAGRRLSGEGGAVRIVRGLVSMPEAIAAWGRDVYLIFPPAGSAQRQILRASVTPAPVGNLWTLDQGERLDAAPSLATRGALIGFVGSDMGPVSLVASADDPARLTLTLLRKDGWVPLNLPPGADGGARRLIAMPAGIGLFVESGDGTAAMWRGRSVPSGQGAGTMEWTSAAMPPLGLSSSGPERLFWFDGSIVFAKPGPEGLSIRSARSTGISTLAVLQSVDPRFGLAPMPQSGRIVVVWAAPKAAAPATDPKVPDRTSAKGHLFVREVSVFTGRILYDGSQAPVWPFSRLEFQLLALLLVAIMVGVLLFVLRPDDGVGTVLLPPSTALAEPWRRAVAGAIDLGLAWTIVSSSLGVTLESLFVPVFGAWMVPTILLVMATACIHCALGEWAFGRSLGKAIAGCRVVRVGGPGDPAPGSAPAQAPSFRAALVRNALRWGVPPLGLAALAFPGARHRGDVLARTGVVVMIEPEDVAGEG